MREADPLKGKPLDRVMAGAVLVAVVAAYAPSLGGGWVWDDHPLIEESQAIHDPERLVSDDLFGAATGESTDVYRPLPLLSHALVQAVAPGPLLERVFSLCLHLLATGLLAGCVGALGVRPRTAWFFAGIWALHPANAEVVAWISGRHELLLDCLVLGAWRAWLRGPGPRWELLAGALMACAPFCKEAGLLVPAVSGLWMLGARRPGWWIFGGAALGSAAYLGLREALALPLPVGAAATEPFASIGALFSRMLTLGFWPGAADALPLYHPEPILGMIAVALGTIGLLACTGRPALCGLLAALALLLPAAPASAQIGLIGDRYFYLVFAMMAAVGAALTERALGARPLPALAFAVLAPLWVLDAGRAAQWRDDATVFGASLARDPTNPHAAFHVAYDLHTRQGDCAAAIPLYRLALDVEPRAGTNLVACLIDTGATAEAASLGARLAAADVHNTRIAANTARAAAMSGDPVTAEIWAREAISRGAGTPKNWVLLGNILGQQGRYGEAADGFRQALDQEPDNAEAQAGYKRCLELTAPVEDAQELHP